MVNRMHYLLKLQKLYLCLRKKSKEWQLFLNYFLWQLFVNYSLFTAFLYMHLRLLHSTVGLPPIRSPLLWNIGERLCQPQEIIQWQIQIQIQILLIFSSRDGLIKKGHLEVSQAAPYFSTMSTRTLGELCGSNQLNSGLRNMFIFWWWISLWVLDYSARFTVISKMQLKNQWELN